MLAKPGCLLSSVGPGFHSPDGHVAQPTLERTRRGLFLTLEIGSLASERHRARAFGTSGPGLVHRMTLCCRIFDKDSRLLRSDHARCGAPIQGARHGRREKRGIENVIQQSFVATCYQATHRPKGPPHELQVRCRSNGCIQARDWPDQSVHDRQTVGICLTIVHRLIGPVAGLYATV